MKTTTTTEENGRLGNQIIRNVCVSYIARKYDIKVEYSSFSRIVCLLGIPLFAHGKNTYPTEIVLNDDNFFSYLFPGGGGGDGAHNIDANASYFQTKEISCFLYSRFFQSPEVKRSVQSKNPFWQGIERAGGGGGGCGGGNVAAAAATIRIFVHVRLTDASEMNPGFGYYQTALSRCFQEIQKEEEEGGGGGGEKHQPKKCAFYVATDDYAHPLIREISSFLLLLSQQQGGGGGGGVATYVHQVNHLVHLSDVETMQFGSVCEYLVLSHGSFSAITGYMAYSSKSVFYPSELYASRIWFGDMFSGIPGWKCIV